MADPGFVTSNIVTSGTANSSSITTTVPAGANEGDKVLLILAMNPSGAAAGPNTPGWTMVPGFGVVDSGTSVRFYVFEADVTDEGDVDPGASIVIPFTGTSRAVACMYVVGPCEVLSDDIATYAPGGTHSGPPYSVTLPTVTVDEPCRLLYIWSGGVWNSGEPDVTFTADAALTERQQGCSSQGVSRNSVLLVADEVMAAPGTSTARTSTMSGALRRLGAVIPLSTPIVRPIATASTPTPVVAEGTEDLQLNGAASDGGGAGSPYTWAWDLQSGPGSVTFSSQTVQNPTVTSALEAGTYVFRLVVTDDDDVESLPSTVAVTVLGPGGTVTPVSEVTNAGWTQEPSGATGPEVLGDGSDDTYTIYADPEGTVVREVVMGEWAPTPGRGGTASYRPSMLGSAGSVMFFVKNGASTTVASFGPDVWTEPGEVEQFDHALSPAQVAELAPYTDIRFRWEGEVTP